MNQIESGGRNLPTNPGITRAELFRRGGVTVALVAGTPTIFAAGCSTSIPRVADIKLTSLEQTVVDLRKFAAAKSIELPGKWTPAHVFRHCAQSIEYSMSGYPKMNSWLFRNTIGPIAKSKFIGDGQMSHDINDPIPGAPDIANSDDHSAAIGELIVVIEKYSAYRDELRDHFAFGGATHEQYEKLHAMHIADHLSAMTIV